MTTALQKFQAAQKAVTDGEARNLSESAMNKLWKKYFAAEDALKKSDGFAGLVPALFGSPWYTVAAVGAVWYFFIRKPAPKTVTTVVGVGQAQARGVVGVAPAQSLQAEPGQGTVLSNSPTNSNPYAVEELLQKDAMAKAETVAMTQGILKQPGALSGYRRNPYLVN